MLDHVGNPATRVFLFWLKPAGLRKNPPISREEN
jgi:hypothetical protein